MKLLRMFILLGVTAILFNSCETGDDLQNDRKLDELENIIVHPDADGALYAKRELSGYTGSDPLEEADVVHAWFGNKFQSEDAGAVKVNNYTFNGPTSPGAFFYYGVGNGDEILNNGNNVNWIVPGSGSLNGFIHADNSVFPSGGTFELPSSIDINNNFTLTHEPIAGTDSIVYSLWGYEGQIDKLVPGGSTSITFTSGEMKAVSESGGKQIVFKINAVNIHVLNYNGKKYYFIKQSRVARSSVTQ